MLEFETAPVFTDYIRLWQGVKEAEDRKGADKNAVRREASKLFMNSLYGKTLQREDFDQTIVAGDYVELGEALATQRVRSITVLEEQAVEVVCAPTPFEVSTRLPTSLGAAILAISQIIIMDYLYKSV